MSVQPMISNEDKTAIEVNSTNEHSVRKWPLVAVFAFLILIEVGGTFLLCYR